jgi:hypothetical protein
MKSPIIFWGGAILMLPAASVVAQPVTATVSVPTTANIYAQQQIDLLPGFETTTAGFEARIKQPEATAGRWSAPLLWTDYKRYADLNTVLPPNTSRNDVTGMIGIHTHVLPNGKVLSWEGHNDDSHVQPTAGVMMSHAYDWNPNPSGQNGTQVYPNVYSHFDNAYSNIFCSGHSFLADGRLLVAGGHYSAGKVYRNSDGSDALPYLTSTPINSLSNPEYIPPTSTYPDFSLPNVNAYIGVRDVNIFNYAATNANSIWQARA